MFSLASLVVLFPALGVGINALLGRRLREQQVGAIAAAAAGLAFGVAVALAVALTRVPEGVVVEVGTWFTVGGLTVPWGLQVDTLSVTLLLVVTGVGTLIHLYAIGYMHGDPGFARFFVYLNLFLVAMTLLVMANNYLVLFVGWEGVGLCSFLLIGFWFDQGEGGTGNARAGRKAFIVNRIGDFGLIMAMILIYWQFGSLTFTVVWARAAALAVGTPVVVTITLLLLLGATGKSAQIPLFVWLPEAMAGPTPASALIHAATMVTAGIYLMVRSHGLLVLAPPTQLVMALIGATTALLAATVAVAQNDIKRVLAYSTISQLGFMVTAVGLGAYGAAIFHLITHAFFKALLFLAAGSVIHALKHGETAVDPQDMGQMGGLRRRLPLTFAVYLVGGLALAGVPPLAGFFSKDEILTSAWATNRLVFVLLLLTVGLTAVYIGRQLMLVFAGQPRSAAAAQAHESTLWFTCPLLALAALTLLGGGLNLPGVYWLNHWLGQTLGEGETAVFNLPLAVVSALVAGGGTGLAAWLYRPSAAIGDPLARRLGTLFAAAQAQWGIDAAYTRLVVHPYGWFSSWLERQDRAAFVWLEQGLSGLVRQTAVGLQRTQTGQLNWNVAAIVAGLAIVLLLLVIGR